MRWDEQLDAADTLTDGVAGIVGSAAAGFASVPVAVAFRYRWHYQAEFGLCRHPATKETGWRQYLSR